MKIKQIFERDITRHIKPAVVAGEHSSEVVETEIKEYVFTNDLATNLFRTLNTIIHSKSGNAGIWISGYYGSGKSHFLKYIKYCLDSNTSKAAFDHLETSMDKLDSGLGDITLSQVRNLRLQMEKMELQTILFNIDEVAGDNSGERLTRIFLNRFNRMRGYNSVNIPLATLLEKELDEKGVFEAFKEKISELKFDWQKESDRLIRRRLGVVLDIAASLIPDLSIDSLASSLKNPETFHISVADTLIPELQEYLEKQDKSFKLIFLVDEVSQFLGQNKEMLLNLQTIIESVSQNLGNRVWVGCTAQQDLRDVVKGVNSSDHKDEFGKILGRFDVKISLESNDPTYITQKRVLDKSSEGIKALSELYRKNRNAIEHQFNFGSSLYRGYQSEDDFLLSYPFIPYQFKLISDVLASFQQLRYVISEVKDNARSVIGLTHFTVKRIAEKDIGLFVPFDAFLGDIMRANMQNIATRTLNQVMSLSWIKPDSFEERVVKNLFMISHLTQAYINTFPPDVEHLAMLMMQQPDENKLDLQKKVTDVLQKLIDENIIRRESGRYFFYNEDEFEVTNLIRSQVVGLEEKYTELDAQFFKPLLKIESKVRVGSNDFRIGYMMEDKEIFRNGEVQVWIQIYDTTPLETQAMLINADTLLVGIAEWFCQDITLRKDFDWYCMVNHYLLRNAPLGVGERKRTNESFAERNKLLKEQIKLKIERQFVNTRFVSKQQVWQADEISGANPRDRFAKALEMHILAVYDKLEMAGEYSTTEQDLRQKVLSNELPFPNLTPAEILVNDYITSMGNTLSVEEVLRKFENKPFGWRPTQIIHVLVMLHRKKKRTFEYNNEPRYPIKEFVDKAINTRERGRCIVKSTDELSAEDIDNAISAFSDVFNEDLPHTHDGNKLFDTIREKLVEFRRALKPSLEKLYGNYPFGKHLHYYDELLAKWLQLNDPRKLFAKMSEQQEEARQLNDAARAIRDFEGRMLAEYLKLHRFVNDNRTNFGLLEDEDKQKAEDLEKYLHSDMPQIEFRHKLKQRDELRNAINKLAEDLKGKTIAIYGSMIEELNKEATKRDVEASRLLPDLTHLEEKIKQSNSLPEIQLKLSHAGDYKTTQLRKIIEEEQKVAELKAIKEGKQVAAVAEPEEFYFSKVVSTISNEEELDMFIEKIRNELLAKLRANKTIIVK